MYSYLLVAVVVIVFIVLIYWLCINGKDSTRRNRARSLIHKSGGTFDDEARAALMEINNIDDMTPEDRFQRGRIVRYNVLQGGVANARALDVVVRDFAGTLAGMHEATRIHTRVAPQGGMFMLHNIEELGRDIADDDMIAQIYFGFLETVNDTVPAVRQEIIEQRVARATESNTTRLGAVNDALDDAVTYTNDPQNVHDSSVNNDLRDTLMRLKTGASDDLDVSNCIDSARDYITANRAKLGYDKTERALQVLETIRKGDTISTYKDTEDHIFALTWDRCSDPRNRDNAALMREAVITALADSVENGNQVCINGRTGHVLNSLATLDYDPALGSAMTFEAYRNQIYQESKEIINSVVESAKLSTDGALRASAEAFEAGDSSLDTASDDRFKNDLRSRIDNNIDTYEKKLTPKDLSSIKEECHVYAMVD